MADSSDVEQSLAGVIAAGLYPSGPAAASTLGGVVKVYRGWPASAALDADLAAGTVNVTVALDPAGQSVTTRHMDTWYVGAQTVPTLTAAVSGDTAVFAGDARPGQIAGILVDGLAAVHPTVAGDTEYTVAVALATGLASRDAMAIGNAVQVIGARDLAARVVAVQPSRQQARRQLQLFRIACWCPDPASRDATVAAVDAILAPLAFLTLPDGLSGRLRFVRSVASDRAQAAALYRRDLLYGVEYATSIGTDLPRLLFGNARVAVAGRVTDHLT